MCCFVSDRSYSRHGMSRSVIIKSSYKLYKVMHNILRDRIKIIRHLHDIYFAVRKVACMAATKCSLLFMCIETIYDY